MGRNRRGSSTTVDRSLNDDRELTAAAHIAQVAQPGKAFSPIGRSYRVTYQATMEANDPTDPGLIEVGQELIIPLTRAAPFAVW